MAFPRSLDTKVMGEYVTHHFAWDRCRVAFPSLSLPKNFQPLYPGFELAVAEEAAEYYELLESPQVIFYVMLLNEAERLGVSLELALIELRGAPSSRGSSYMVTGSSKLDSAQWLEPVDRKRARKWSRRMRTRPLKRQPPIRVVSKRVISTPVSLVSVAFPPIYNTREMANYVRESFNWHWRSASRLPRPLPEDFHALCPLFSLSEAEGAAADFELPEIVQATFYTILLNEAIELGMAYDFMTESIKSSLVGLRWSTFEVWIGCVNHRPTDEVEVRRSRDGQEEGSGLHGPPTPSSDEE
ncbi:hypothetical protein Cgig2_013687 [Carnegiea gigantea]|uniref:Uncharacterized protein n=1 Tax=Carnegiea gigantea TaxID=171969 RepID=A0A9Q1KED6_9CARY|nr:hypothetical protein Cgig2_013687 [Carnegiea gigantea]